MDLPDFLVQAPDGDIHLRGHRIGLLHLVYYYNEGYSPEMLVAQYPTLPLALVHKVIAFYLENREDVSGYVDSCTVELTRQRLSGPRSLDLESLRHRLEKLQQAAGGIATDFENYLTFIP